MSGSSVVKTDEPSSFVKPGISFAWLKTKSTKCGATTPVGGEAMRVRGAAVAASNAALSIFFSSSIPLRTTARRWRAFSGLRNGEYLPGEEMSPASIAASGSSRRETPLPK